MIYDDANRMCAQFIIPRRRPGARPPSPPKELARHNKNLSDEKKSAGLGSVWTWTCIDADTKLVPSWLVGSRDAGTAYEFIAGCCEPAAASSA